MSNTAATSCSADLQTIFHVRIYPDLPENIRALIIKKNDAVSRFFNKNFQSIFSEAATGLDNTSLQLLNQSLTTFFSAGQNAFQIRDPGISRSRQESIYLYTRKATGRSGAVEYFIYPRLREVLLRHLDRETGQLLLTFFRQNKIASDPPEKSAAFSMITAFRRIAEVVIGMAADIEESIVRSYNAPREISHKRFCATIDRVHRDLWPVILANSRQVQDWRNTAERLGPAGKSILETESLNVAFLETHEHLCVDTIFFDDSFRKALSEMTPELETDPDGILISGNNYHGLRYLQSEHLKQIQCIYIDPPFNTGKQSFDYPDAFSQAAWLTMMENRMIPACELLTDTGTFFAHIDHNQSAELKLLLDRHLHFITEIIWRIGWISGFKSRARKFIRNHDTIYHYGKSIQYKFYKEYISYPDGYLRRDGKPPTGPGYPLEDTWNCSTIDSLNSIQILSFTKEKIGSAGSTQKNENLLERIIACSTEAGDMVLDYFAGSGTTCAAAHKMDRKWIGMDRTERIENVLVPRMKKVLSGDPYGISTSQNWQGGGVFHIITLKESSHKPNL